MKTIELLRHAKSSWKNPLLSDHQRPLKGRGRHDCEVMGQVIRELGGQFENCCSSSATRACETIKRVMTSSGLERVDFTEYDELYCFDADTLVDWLQALPDTWHSVMIVAHNPALTSLGRWLTDIHQAPGHLPTCAYLRVRCSVDDWVDLSSGCGTVTHFESPKMHRG